MTRRIALVIEYDGTGYAGFQRQADAPSIQEELENAIESLTTVRATVRGAGRTDAGVHALAQVGVFDTQSTLPTERVVAGLNHYLGEQIAVRAAYDVPLSFDPRRHAGARVYRYRLLEGGTPSPLRRGVTHRVVRRLDTGAMSLAAASLVGEHDFRAFSGPQPAGKSFVRRMTRATVFRYGDEVIVELEANAFLPQQVRRTAGALVDVGLGRLTVSAFEQMIESGAQGAVETVLPARGLTLQEVRYAGFPPENDATTTHDETYETGSP
ncbi:MAG: tRNA pseudouridine(38-40) synthase TruA [Chloroflexi bacterium]|nr:tRNA pseudouridine(38-40) synthase TruA [Chloroflexota bacterium]MYK33599.1 tRNA pseudouridine(38-40) synthase TruA [Chloroflexota bacterium]